MPLRPGYRATRHDEAARGEHREVGRHRENSVTEPVGDVADRGAGKADQNYGRVAKSGDGDQRDAERERQRRVGRHDSNEA